MDYSQYKDFPFPAQLSNEESKSRDYFFSLSDQEQLDILNASASYEIFLRQVSLYGGPQN